MSSCTKLAVLLFVCAVQTQAGTLLGRDRSDLLNVLFKRLVNHEKRQQPDIYATCELAVNTAATQGQQLSGTIHLLQKPGENTRITGEVSGFSGPGSLHGFHVHVSSDPDNNCNNNEGHYNPFGKNHGGPNATDRHVGDLGNIRVCSDGSGRAPVEISDPQVKLSGPESVIDRSIVVHVGQDDLGLGGEPDSRTTGHAGGRLACCKIIQQANVPEAPIPKAKKCPAPEPPTQVKREELIQRFAQALHILDK